MAGTQKLTCLIDLKLAGSVEQVSKSLYIDFQAILKFYKNMGNLSLKAIGASYGPVSMQIN